MAAATGEREVLYSLGREASYPVKADTKIWMGTLVALVGGYAAPAEDDDTHSFVGVAQETVDNTGGANGDLRIKVYREGVGSFKGSGFVAADTGKGVYVESDQEVALYDDVDDDVFVGTIEEVIGANDVRVKLSPHAIPDESDVSKVLARIADNEDDIAAIAAENTDAFVWVGPDQFRTLSGAWTYEQDGSLAQLTRVASSGTGAVRCSVSLICREAANKGLQLNAVDWMYSVDTADLDDVKGKVVMTEALANGTKPDAVALAGDNDVEYDTAHNTAAKRGADDAAPEQHRMTITVPSPEYIEADKGLDLRLAVDGDGGGSGVFKFYGALMKFSQTSVDLAD